MEKENPAKVGSVFKLCGLRCGGEGSACKAASLGLTKKIWLAGGFAACSPLQAQVATLNSSMSMPIKKVVREMKAIKTKMSEQEGRIPKLETHVGKVGGEQ